MKLGELRKRNEAGYGRTRKERVNLYLSKNENKALEKICKKTKETKSDCLRRLIIDEFNRSVRAL